MNSASPGRWVGCILKIAFLMGTGLLTPWIKMLLQLSHSVPQQDSSPGPLNHSISLTVLPLLLLTKREKNTALSAGRDQKGVYFFMIQGNLSISPFAGATGVAGLRCRVGWLECNHWFFNAKDTLGHLTLHHLPIIESLAFYNSMEIQHSKEVRKYHVKKAAKIIIIITRFLLCILVQKPLEVSDWSQSLPKEKILALAILLQVQKHPGKINSVLSGWIFIIHLQAPMLL